MDRLIVRLLTLRIHCLLGLAYVYTVSWASMQTTSTIIFTTFSLFVLPHPA